jgi:hypothetical protein
MPTTDGCYAGLRNTSRGAAGNHGDQRDGRSGENDTPSRI